MRRTFAFVSMAVATFVLQSCAASLPREINRSDLGAKVDTSVVSSEAEAWAVCAKNRLRLSGLTGLAQLRGETISTDPLIVQIYSYHVGEGRNPLNFRCYFVAGKYAEYKDN